MVILAVSVVTWRFEREPRIPVPEDDRTAYAYRP